MIRLIWRVLILGCAIDPVFAASFLREGPIVNKPDVADKDASILSTWNATRLDGMLSLPSVALCCQQLALID
jgi:hypothetical protein